jgi:hypothetical protein
MLDSQACGYSNTIECLYTLTIPTNVMVRYTSLDLVQTQINRHLFTYQGLLYVAYELKGDSDNHSEGRSLIHPQTTQQVDLSWLSSKDGQEDFWIIGVVDEDWLQTNQSMVQGSYTNFPQDQVSALHEQLSSYPGSSAIISADAEAYWSRFISREWYIPVQEVAYSSDGSHLRHQQGTPELQSRWEDLLARHVSSFERKSLSRVVRRDKLIRSHVLDVTVPESRVALFSWWEKRRLLSYVTVACDYPTTYNVGCSDVGVTLPNRLFLPIRQDLKSWQFAHSLGMSLSWHATHYSQLGLEIAQLIHFPPCATVFGG